MPKARLYFDGDDGIQKDSRIYKLRDDIAQKIENVPTVIDNTSSSSRTDALSANMGRDLQEQINNLAARGRYLSTRNAVTGLPETQPQTNPYVYRAGDYYIVSNIGVTNYRPQGASYTIGVRSTAEEHAAVNVNDLYIYDGVQWILQGSTSTSVAWGSIVGNIANQGDLQNELNDKADVADVLTKTNTTSYTPTADYHPATKKYSDDNDTYIGTSAPTDNVVEGRLWYDTTNDILKVYNGSQWVPTGKTYTAGRNIAISNADVISATGLQEKLIAGENVTIETECFRSDKGPCPDGFHIATWAWSGAPYSGGWDLADIGKLNDYLATLGVTDMSATMKFPNLRYWAPSQSTSHTRPNICVGWYIRSTSSGTSFGWGWVASPSEERHIRPVKNTPVIPDGSSSWVTLFDGSSIATDAGVFWNEDEGIISVSSDGTNWITVADKNLGATQVWNSGDTLTAANAGNLYQRGNNFGRPYGTTPTTTSEQVDVSSYGPQDYYYREVKFTSSPWMVANNPDLWGWPTPYGARTICQPKISATDTGQTYSAGNGISIDANNEITADTTVLATKTDLTSKQDKMFAGRNISIDGTTINARDTEYTEGSNITITCPVESDMKGPAPSGFHIPLYSERESVIGILITTFGLAENSSTLKTYLKMPAPGYVVGYGNVTNFNYDAYYWSATPWGPSASVLHSSPVFITRRNSSRNNGYSVRCFKNTPVIPDSSSDWATLYDGSSIATGAGVFYNAGEGVISLSGDGTNWITIADKNLGATVVYNNGDTPTDASCGNFYQRGNCYGFPHNAIMTMENINADVNGYGPGNYYYSTVWDTNWHKDRNSGKNLWGGQTQGTWQDCEHPIISATGGATYTAGDNIDITNNVISAENVIKTDTTNDAGFRIEGSNGEYYDNTSISSVVLGNEPNEHQNGQLSFDVGTGILSTSYTENAQGTTYESTRLAIDNYAIDVEYEYDNGGGDDGSYTEHYTWLGEGPTGSATDKIAKLGDIQNVMSSGTTAPSNPTEGQLWYDTTNDVLKVYDGTNWNNVNTDTTYSAGNGINIDQNDEISVDTSIVATQTDLNSKQDELIAGDNITIGDAYTTESDMKGPAPDGFHVPSITEWEGLKTIMDGLSLTTGTDWRENLRIPSAGMRNRTDAATGGAGVLGSYWSSSPMSSPDNAHYLYISGVDVSLIYEGTRTFGYSIRCFKDSYVVPTSSWTVVQGTLGSAGIFRNQTEGLISITSDGTTGYTIADKNLGATTVWNNGDTLSEANCGKYYQRGNNYGFPFTGNVSTSSTQVDTTGYGPGNYYTGADFIVGIPGSTYDWSNPSNDNLRGGVTQGTWQDCIHNVISAESTTYTAGTGINIDANNEISVDNTIARVADINTKTFYLSSQQDLTNAQAAYDWFRAGKNPIVVLGNEEYVCLRDNNTTNPPRLEFVKVNLVVTEYSTTVVVKREGLGLQYTIGSTTIQSIPMLTFQYMSLNKPTTYTAGTNISIDANNEISATDTTYSAGTGIGIDANNEISNTLPGPVVSAIAPSNAVQGDTWYDTTNDIFKTYDGTSWNVTSNFPGMTILSYGHSTWQDFIDAYNENAVVYCKASSNSNPGSGNQGRMAFMAFIDINNTTQDIQGVEFQYYRSRSSHSTAANVLDEVYIYKLTPASGGTWTVTQRDTAAKPIAGTGIGLTYNSSGMTISADTTVLATQTDLSSINGIVSGQLVPAASSQWEGRIFYCTFDNTFYKCDGTTWTEIGEGGITNDVTGTTSTVTKVWAGTQAEYNALSSYDSTTIYYIV